MQGTISRRRLAAIAAGAVCAAAAPRVASADPSYWEGVVRDAAARHGVSPDWLAGVMYAESGGDPHAYNHRTGDSGLMQFQPATFATFAAMAGIAGDLWNGHDSAEVAAWAFAAGYCDHWVTSGCWDGSPS